MAPTAASGAAFSGYAFYTFYDDTDLYGDGTLWDTYALSGAGVVTASAGVFQMGGYATVGTASADGVDLNISTVTGGFGWDDPDAPAWIR